MVSHEELMQFAELCVSNNIEIRSYSGRSMYGQRCFAVVLDLGDNCDMRWVVQNAVDSEMSSNFLGKLWCFRLDSMGLQSVMYWPDFEWSDEDNSRAMGEEEEED